GARRGGDVRNYSANSRRPAVERLSSVGHTGHGAVLGTPGYMAPEQERGEVERIDERTDVYALGAILSALLTGQPPSPAGVEPPRRRERPLPRALEAICLKALAAEQGERYASVEALAG